jgi:glycosyltransferase involved in cell wall biosynthesis
MNKKNILIISNDKLFIEKNLVRSKYNDTVNIIQGLAYHNSITFLTRKSKKIQNFSTKIFNKINFRLLDLFNVSKFQIFMISITPFNFFCFLTIKLFNKKISGHIYLRSDGHKEYSYKLGIIGFWIYNFMFNYITSCLKVITVSKNITGLKKPYITITPSEIEPIWLYKTKKPKLDKPRLLYVGRYKVEKGVFSLINLINSIKFDALSLKIVGTKEEINLKTTKIKICKETNSKKKIINFYDMCNIFVLPSFTEGSPKVILESLSRQRPVIVFNEILHVKNKFAGVYSCRRNPADLKKLIIYIMKNYNQIRKMIKKNKIITRKQFQKKLNKIIL